MRGEQVIVDGATIVDNVLVHIGETSAISTMESTETTDVIGPIADYILYFPDTYVEELSGKTVTVRGIECEVIGHPDHERPKSVFEGWSGTWDMIVRVKRTLAEFAENIQIFATIPTKDVLGIRTGEGEKVVIYEGDGQARMASGSESDDSTGTYSETQYVFVIDWLDELAQYQTQQLGVIYDGKTYNVMSVENKDERGETAVIRGEWRG